MKGLRPAHTVDLDIICQNLSDLFLSGRRCLREGPLHPPSGILLIAAGIAVAPPFKVIGHVQKIIQRHLMEFQIPHIHDPHIPDSVFIYLPHLLPDPGVWSAVHPFVGNGSPMIVKMVVHSEAALMIPYLLRGQGADIPVIVLAQHAGHALQPFPVLESRRVLITVKVRLHLLVQRQQHGNLPALPLHMPMDQFLLLGDNILEQINVLLHRGLRPQHGRIPLSPHTYGDNVLIFAAALQGVLPIVQESLLIGIKIPLVAVPAALSPNLVPFLAGP